MSRYRYCLCALLLAGCLWPLPARPQEKPAGEQPVVIGILPVYDATGFGWGEEVSQQMTHMLFWELRALPGVRPLLLNPGYYYNPLSDDWTLEYARASAVDLALITTLAEPDHPKNRDATLRLSYRLLRVASAQSTPEQGSRVAMSRRDFNAGIDYGRTWISYRGGSNLSTAYEGSRVFDKQPFGRAARALVQSVAPYVRYHAGPLPAAAKPAAGGKPSSCEISFLVVYAGRGARSKAYNVIINDREESLSMSDGVVRARLASGPVLVRVAIRDAPYKMPVQPLYQANTELDCAATSGKLALEIEQGGQSFLRWQ